MVFIRAHLILIGLATFVVALSEAQDVTHGPNYHRYTNAPTHHRYTKEIPGMRMEHEHRRMHKDGTPASDGSMASGSDASPSAPASAPVPDSTDQDTSAKHHYTLSPHEHRYTYKIPGHNTTHSHRYKIPGHNVIHHHRYKIPEHRRGEEVQREHGEDAKGVYYLINLIYNYFAVGGKLTGVPPVDLLLLRYYVAQGPKNFCPNK